MSSYHEEIVKVSKGIDTFFKSCFEEIHVDGPQLDPIEIQKQPLIAISTHRSHIDYYLFGHQLFNMGFKNLRFAAGDNLTKLPYIGSRFKSFGAFTVQRDTGFERNYVRNLCNSVITMLENREIVIVFPEGGRSYSGSMLEIKGGILSAAIIAQAKNPQLDVCYIPAAVSYDFPPDLPYFKMLLRGKNLRKRSNPFLKRLIGNIYYFGGDILAFTPYLLSPRLKRKYGSVYIDYLSPISIRNTIDIEGNRQENARDDFSAHRTSMQQFSQIIYNQLQSLYRLMPMHVVAAILTKKNPVKVSEARDSIGKHIDYLQTKNYNLKMLAKMTNSQIFESGIGQLLRFKAISLSHGILSVKKPDIISYYNAFDKPGA